MCRPELFNYNVKSYFKYRLRYYFYEERLVRPLHSRRYFVIFRFFINSKSIYVARLCLYELYLTIYFLVVSYFWIISSHQIFEKIPLSFRNCSRSCRHLHRFRHNNCNVFQSMMILNEEIVYRFNFWFREIFMSFKRVGPTSDIFVWSRLVIFERESRYSWQGITNRLRYQSHVFLDKSYCDFSQFERYSRTVRLDYCFPLPNAIFLLSSFFQKWWLSTLFNKNMIWMSCNTPVFPIFPIYSSTLLYIKLKCNFINWFTSMHSGVIDNNDSYKIISDSRDRDKCDLL